MTQSFSRLLGLPFALALIFLFTRGSFDFAGWQTIAVMICLIALTLLYVFQDQINKWWWRRKMPNLPKPLATWLGLHSPYFNSLEMKEREEFSKKISTFMLVKEYTLKANRDYQLEEDIKCLISHEFVKVAHSHGEYLYEGIDQFVIYPHAFPTPEIKKLHTVEFHREHGVVIFSREALVNGFLHPQTYVNVALLGSILSFVHLHPRLHYPESYSVDKKSITEAHDIELDVLYAAVGNVEIENLTLLIFCYFLYPEKTKVWDLVRYEQLNAIFKY